MTKTICIVISGDPANIRFDYSDVHKPLRQLLESNGADVLLAEDTNEAIQKLEEETVRQRNEKLPVTKKYVVFISSYYCEEAIRLAKEHGPRFRFVVYTVGSIPHDMPILVSAGMFWKKNIFNDVFD